MSEQDTVSLSRTALIAGAAALLIAFVAALVLWPRSPAPPDINGAILPTPKPVDELALQDHRGQRYTAADLQGDWHLITYGFTYCPDICPTTLREVAQFRSLLRDTGQFGDLTVLFYTVDPQRDTQAQLAEYLSWFDPAFVGLRATSDQAASRFEDTLGINARIIGDASRTDYQVAHGMMLYLIDDRGQLRAALAPVSERDGRQYFDPQVLLRDYLAFRAWDRQQG